MNRKKHKNSTESDIESIVYTRERERTKRLGISKKLIYGIGEMPYGILNSVIGTFLMLYYVQIIGLSASSVGLLIGLALLLDALTDPILAEFSDRFRSRLGRRHAFMYLSSIPLGLSLYCLMSPPQGLEEPLMLAWIGFFLVSARPAIPSFRFHTRRCCQNCAATMRAERLWLPGEECQLWSFQRSV